MTTTRRSRTAAKAGAGLAGLALAALTVLGFSDAAFRAQTDNADNNWATSGFVTLDDDLTAPMFSVGLNGAGRPYTGEYDSELAVGEGIADRQITVTFGGRARADVRMYVDPGYTATRGLDADTLVTVLRDGTPIYSDVPLDQLPTGYGGAGASSWQVGPAADDAVYTVSIETTSSAQAGATIEDVTFVWEAQQAG
ncbi:MAG TPA: hypothetical protein VKZ72_02140 [Acidimicrobiales bacterium]|nr:hypothetical protein [Acidimicrobiales bacterium]